MGIIQENTRRMVRCVRSSQSSTRRRNSVIAITIAGVLFGGLPGPLKYAEAQSRNQDVQHVVVTLNKSLTLQLPRSFASAVVGSPEFVDALPMSDRRLYIQGKKVGTTNLS